MRNKKYLVSIFATNLANHEEYFSSHKEIREKILEIADNENGRYPCCEDVEFAVYRLENDFPDSVWSVTSRGVHIEKF